MKTHLTDAAFIAAVALILILSNEFLSPRYFPVVAFLATLSAYFLGKALSKAK
jgi:hypothetical protein